MNLLRKLASDRRFQGLLFALMLMGALTGLLAWQMGVTLADFRSAWTTMEEHLETHPSTLFWALVLLPGLPVPTSALLLTAGIVWRDRPVMACLLCLLALLLNFSWTYWVAAGPGRKVVERILAATPLKVPELPKGDQLKLILVLKLTPGIPLFLQNYLLGFLRAPFHLYLAISLLANGIIGTGVVLSGAGLSDGRVMPAISGIFLIAAGAILTKSIRGWIARRKQA